MRRLGGSEKEKIIKKHRLLGENDGVFGEYGADSMPTEVIPSISAFS
jgi:hypothetical protein